MDIKSLKGTDEISIGDTLEVFVERFEDKNGEPILSIEKAKKEEEELAERKRIRDEKEKETQRLREKQERAQDKQAELDAIRAKRAFEEAERKAREKEISFS